MLRQRTVSGAVALSRVSRPGSPKICHCGTSRFVSHGDSRSSELDFVIPCQLAPHANFIALLDVSASKQSTLLPSFPSELTHYFIYRRILSSISRLTIDFFSTLCDDAIYPIFKGSKGIFYFFSMSQGLTEGCTV